MNAKIIFYKQEKLDQNTKFKLRRDLLGTEQKSNFSRYKYKIPGLLDKIPYYKPVKSAIIAKNKDISKIKKVLNDYNAEYEVFEIKIPVTKITQK